jgi:uncharacterized protein (TIGR02265 family)
MHSDRQPVVSASLHEDVGTVYALHPLFDGLFGRALEMTPDLELGLRLLGYDVHAPCSRYPIELWSDCLLLATMQCPRENEHLALERLGRKFIEGWFETLLGKLIDLSVLPFVSLRALLERLPALVESVISHSEPALLWNEIGRAHV